MGEHGCREGQVQNYRRRCRCARSRSFGQSYTHPSVTPGSGGLTVANQIYNRFRAAGKPLNEADILVLDAAEYHYYQVRVSCVTYTVQLLTLVAN